MSFLKEIIWNDDKKVTLDFFCTLSIEKLLLYQSCVYLSSLYMASIVCYCLPKVMYVVNWYIAVRLDLRKSAKVFLKGHRVKSNCFGRRQKRSQNWSSLSKNDTVWSSALNGIACVFENLFSKLFEGRSNDSHALSDYWVWQSVWGDRSSLTCSHI